MGLIKKHHIKTIICHYARPIASKNTFALMLVPFAMLGFLWGYAFPWVYKVAASPKFLKFLGSVNAEGLALLVSTVPFILATYFAIYPICRSIQLLLPETFDDSDYQELND
jgi:hypothetical protein